MRRTEDEAKKVAEHKAAVQGYKLKMTALRKEIQQEVSTKDPSHGGRVFGAKP